MSLSNKSISSLCKRDFIFDDSFDQFSKPIKKIKIQQKVLSPSEPKSLNTNSNYKRNIEQFNQVKSSQQQTPFFKNWSDLKSQLFTPINTPKKNSNTHNLYSNENSQMLAETFKKEELLFTCSPWSKSLKQIDTTKKLNKEFLGRNYFFGDIFSLVLSRDKMYIYSGDENGNLIQWFVGEPKRYLHLGKILFSINDIQLHPYKNELIVCGRGFGKNFGGDQMVSFSLDEKKVVRHYGEIQNFCDCTPIHSYPQYMAVNSNYLFVATTRGY